MRTNRAHFESSLHFAWTEALVIPWVMANCWLVWGWGRQGYALKMGGTDCESSPCWTQTGLENSENGRAAVDECCVPLLTMAVFCP